MRYQRPYKVKVSWCRRAEPDPSSMGRFRVNPKFQTACFCSRYFYDGHISIAKFGIRFNHIDIMKRLMDVDDLAKYLKLEKQTIYNWLNQRKLTGIKLGGVWRFDRAEIDRWLKTQVRKSRIYRGELRSICAVEKIKN